MKKKYKKKTHEIELQKQELNEHANILKLVNNEMEMVNVELKKQKKEIEDKNNDITASLRYAKLIQTAFLTPQTDIAQMFEESFVFYKQREIVGGDFYWFKKLKPAGDDIYVFAIGDCTGHGIASALLSTFGIAFLNETFSSTSKTNDIDVTIVIQNMQKRIHEVFYDSQDKLKYDGIDMLLGLYDVSTNTIMFYGTNGYLYHIPYSEAFNENNIREYKMTGNLLLMETKSFIPNQQVLNVQKGDILYLCTDGYANQIGGKAGKKYMSKNVIKLISSAQQQRLKNQHTLFSQVIEQWMQPDYEQTDDILVIGLKIG